MRTRPPPPFEALVRGLEEAGAEAIVVVDDGSSKESAETFARVGSLERVHLMRHEMNLGKGSALKSGMRYFIEHLHGCAGLVTVDADGQHALDDVLRLARALQARPEVATLGARMGRVGTSVPPRSRLGNGVVRLLFRLTTRIALTDAQTGLRALPRALLPALVELPGARFEYEMAMLLYLARIKHPLAELPIRALYERGNPGSHFRPVRDSFRVLRAFLGRDG